MGIRSLSSSSIATGAKRSKFWDGSTYLGSYDSIATFAVTSGSTTAITFTSIPQTYKHLEIVHMARTTTGTSLLDLYMRYNGDSGTNYSWHKWYTDGSSSPDGATGAGTQTFAFAGNARESSAAAGKAASGFTLIADYSSTVKYKTNSTLGGIGQNDPLDYVQNGTGMWRSTSAVTSITITTNSGTAFDVGTRFALYGIKG
jgi:hypothetical protein